VRGASAIEELLKDQSSQKLRVFVVWEPILPSDWQSPTQPVLAKLADVRASQYWDKDHLIATLLRQHVPSDGPNCCEHDGILWDLVALYPRRAPLRSAPSFISGPVVKSIGEARTHLAQK